MGEGDASEGMAPRYLGRKVAGTALVVLALGAAVGTFGVEWLRDDWAFGFMPAIGLLPFIVVAAVVVLRRPDNPLGLLLAALSFLMAIGSLAERLETYATGTSVGTLALWVGEWWWVPMLVLLLVAVPLLFPNGQLLTRRWRPVLVLVSVTGTVATVGGWFQSELGGAAAYVDAGLPPVANPIGWAPWPEMEDALPGMMFFPTLFLGVLLGVVSVVLRFRRSRGEERQQLKWAVLGMSAMGLAFLGNVAVEVLFGVRFPAVSETLFISAVPITFGFAILRYRLYDIDRIISRTVSYGLLTAMLGGLYSVGVVGLGGVVRATTGGARGDLVVAASTLAVAALFVPARRRIQATVDRRFNRARYDAQRIVEEFAHGLRDEVDLQALSAGLLEAGSAAMAPRSISIWLRAGEHAGGHPRVSSA